MSFEERIYEKLRANRATRQYKNRAPEDTNRSLRRARTRGEYQEKFSDFTPTEVKKLLLEEQIAKKFKGLIGSGKEANIYWIKNHKNEFEALKMFRVHATSHNFSQLHVRSKLSDTAKLGIASGLCFQEYMYLHDLYEAGVRCPKPLWKKGFIYSMEFLGDNYEPSPLLDNVDVRETGHDPQEVMDDVLDQLDIMFNKAQIVHGDFSEHNIIWHDEQPYVIDVLQARKWHPDYATEARIKKRDALKILKRDIKAILMHFKRVYRITYDPEVVFENLPDEEVDDWVPDDLLSENYDLDTHVEESKKVRIDSKF